MARADQTSLFPSEERLRLRFVNGQVVDESGQVYDVQAAIDSLPWVTARPSSGAPHQYVVLRRSNAAAFDILACAIAQSPDGYRAYHRGYRVATRYWEFEGWRHWRTSSGSGGRQTHMVNRARLDSDPVPLRRVNEGAKPIKWDGPPWLEDGSPWPPGYVVHPNGSHTYHPELDPRRRYQCSGCGRRVFFEPNWPCRHCGTVAPEQMP